MTGSYQHQAALTLTCAEAAPGLSIVTGMATADRESLDTIPQGRAFLTPLSPAPTRPSTVLAQHLSQHLVLAGIPCLTPSSAMGLQLSSKIPKLIKSAPCLM